MIRIITDSTSDITQEEAKHLGIDVVPLKVSFGEDSYIDGVSITNDEFYDKLEHSVVLPKTSQANPYEFEELYEEYVKAGDEIISIHLSAHLSGTYQSACIAAASVGNDRISVIDSQNVTGALNVLVRIAVMLRDEGLSREVIVSRLRDYIPRLMLYIAIDTLEYLKKGGRIKASAAMLGGAISLHPVLNLKDGEVVIAGKIIGEKSAYKWLVNKIVSDDIEENLPIYVGHSAAENKAEMLTKKLLAAGVGHVDGTVSLGSVVGTYAGNGAVGVFYVAKSKENN